MIRRKLSPYVLCCFLGMLLLLFIVALTSILKVNALGSLAGDLNGRMVAKTRIADEIIDLGQQIRFVDAFLLRSTSLDQDQLASRMIDDRVQAIRAATASYMPFVDSDLERSLLRNLERSRTAYVDLQAGILAMPVAERAAAALAMEDRLAAGFDQANRMAKGLGHLAETETRAARQKVASIAEEAKVTVVVVSILAAVLGVAILALLNARIYRPLMRLTRALLELADGKLDVVLRTSGRADEIDAMTQALEVFRRNASELALAHEKIKAAHELADTMARHDVLTGLPNRRLLADHIKTAVARAARIGEPCAVLLLDLDRFKPVNDIHGHAAGDRVLCEVADRLNKVVRRGETAARLGGDEFAVVVEAGVGNEAAVRVAKRIIASLGEPIEIDGTRVVIGCSVGIALCPLDGTDADALLRSADLAMFKAKHEQRGSFRFFEPDMDVQLRVRADLESRVRAAVANGDVRPHYQPLVDLGRQRILGFEILARWHEGDTIIPPNEFIPIAEESGLMADLTYSVLRQACRDAQAWPDHLTLALNITPAQIADLDMPSQLLGVLAQEGFAPNRLEIEVTENALIGDISAAKAVMAELRRSGIRIALDDFGTGYSSLHHLRELKFDKIKIDQSFVRTMLDNPDSATIIETIIGLGRSLGMSAVAEGIEEGRHLETLRTYGCQFGQGYFLGRPVGGETITDLLTRQEAPTAVAA